METAVPALIAAVAAVVIAWMQRGNRKAIREVKDEVTTNHGMRAGEHIEQFGTGLAELKSAVLDGIAEMGGVLADTLAEHTASDASNFEELRALLRAQDETSAERTALTRTPRH